MILSSFNREYPEGCPGNDANLYRYKKDTRKDSPTLGESVLDTRCGREWFASYPGVSGLPGGQGWTTVDPQNGNVDFYGRERQFAARPLFDRKVWKIENKLSGRDPSGMMAPPKEAEDTSAQERARNERWVARNYPVTAARNAQKGTGWTASEELGFRIAPERTAERQATRSTQRQALREAA